MQVNFKFGGAGYPTGAECTFGTDPTGLDVDDVAAVFAGLWTGGLRGSTSDAVTLNSILVKAGPNDVAPSTELAVGTACTRQQGARQPGVARLVQKRTMTGGRKGRGRFYWPIGETQVLDGGAVGSTGLTGFQSTFDDFFDGAAAADCPLVLLHADPITLPST